MVRLLLILLLTVAPTVATAGIRATYRVADQFSVEIDIADNGDVSTILGGQRLIVRDGQAFIIEARLTGPLVQRVDDLAALAPDPSRLEQPIDAAGSRLVERGTAELNGRPGRAFYLLGDSPVMASEPMAVLSDDPALARLAAALHYVVRARTMLTRHALLLDDRVATARHSGEMEDMSDELIDMNLPESEAVDLDESPPFPEQWRPLDEYDPRMLALLERGAPLQYGYWVLRKVESWPASDETPALPAEPETREEISARLAAEVAAMALGPSQDRMISRALFAAGRLWLLTDSGGLTSLAEGDTVRSRHDPGGDVLDMCVRGDAPVVLTGRRDGQGSWAIRHWDGGNWPVIRSMEPSSDSLVAMNCTNEGELLLTSRHLVELDSGGAREVDLSDEASPSLVRTVLHITPEAVFVGLNLGEWGGGLKRIDRRTGRVTRIARNATGSLCGGPLNTDCDPVNGIVTLPWRPECVVAAVGLIHMLAHGRLVQVCPDSIEQLFAAIDEIDPEHPERAAEAAQGGYDSVAFFGLATQGGRLIAAGHNGIHRLGADGVAEHQLWPRFVEVDGVLVSFAIPGIVLVVSSITGRASLGGGAPLLVTR